MAVPTGQASMAQIQSEFGGSNPISLSEYYSGGSLTRANLGIFAPNGVPTSGQISINDFRGAENTSETWTVAVNFAQSTPPLVGGTVQGRGILSGPALPDNTPDNGRIMKTSRLDEVAYTRPDAPKGSPPSPVTFGVTFNTSTFIIPGGIATPNANNNLDSFKFITDAGVRTYQRSAATYNAASTTMHVWDWPNSPFGGTTTRNVTFDCN